MKLKMAALVTTKHAYKWLSKVLTWFTSTSAFTYLKKTHLSTQDHTLTKDYSCCTVLTSHVSEVNCLSVGVEQLDNGVVIVLHPTADDRHLALHHRHIVRHQVLTHNWTGQEHIDYHWCTGKSKKSIRNARSF